jgi:CubicO group peptidase (beta-lactamase class C family)
MMQSKLTKQLKEYMQRLSKHRYFNGSVLVAQKGEVLLKEGYGYADLNYDIPNTSFTKFRVGSLTKAFTAMSILILHKHGKLNIEETIDTILPDFPNGDIITIFHLLTHSSGIPNFTSSPEYWIRTMRLPSNLLETMDSFKELPLEFDPGERMEYTNSGYIVLTAIIEKTSGMSYAEFLKKSIFNKLEMQDTGVDNGREIIKNRAEGYTIWEKMIHTDFVDMSFPLGAYGIYSTIDDLFKWNRALINCDLVDRSLQGKMFTPYLSGYGFGWFIDDVASHLGDINGFVNYFYLDLEKELTIIALSNLNITPVIKISTDLADIVNGKKVDVLDEFSLEESTLNLEKYSGVFKNDRGTISFEFNEGLYVTISKMYGVAYKFQVHPTKENQQVFKSEYLHDTYIFQLDEKGGPLSCQLIDAYGGTETFRQETVISRNA